MLHSHMVGVVGVRALAAVQPYWCTSSCAPAADEQTPQQGMLLISSVFAPLSASCPRPCRGQRREETFENVLRNPLTFPAKPSISPEAQDLIGKLLVKDPAQRLGTKVGGREDTQQQHKGCGAGCCGVPRLFAADRAHV